MRNVKFTPGQNSHNADEAKQEENVANNQLDFGQDNCRVYLTRVHIHQQWQYHATGHTKRNGDQVKKNDAKVVAVSEIRLNC